MAPKAPSLPRVALNQGFDGSQRFGEVLRKRLSVCDSNPASALTKIAAMNTLVDIPNLMAQLAAPTMPRLITINTTLTCGTTTYVTACSFITTSRPRLRAYSTKWLYSCARVAISITYVSNSHQGAPGSITGHFGPTSNSFGHGDGSQYADGTLAGSSTSAA